MKMSKRIICMAVSAVLLLLCLMPTAFAKAFAPSINYENVGVHTQYLYAENNPSWLRKLVIKEDRLTIGGLMEEAPLIPICSYPYTTDAESFKKEVAQNIELFSLDKDSQKAAYIYLLEQFGAISLFTEAPPEGMTKADWLRSQGIIITPEDETDTRKAVMINALYALMKNDFYYVYKGGRLDIPSGTPLEEAVVTYLVALSDQESQLSKFIQNYFGKTSYGSLDDYVYYTSLLALYTTGYVTANELNSDNLLSEDEVSRRLAIKTINTAGIAIDADNATNEEISLKYLTAMLNTNYKVTLEPERVERALKRDTVAYYILQQMAIEDAKIAIQEFNYSYEECFNTVLRKTHRFDLESEFYSDIHEYEAHLNYFHTYISISPTPISSSGVTVYINGEKKPADSYSKVYLEDKQVNVVNVKCTASDGSSSNYKINIYQGTVPAPESDITNKIPTIGNFDNITVTDASGKIIPQYTGTVSLNINGVDVEVPDVLNPAMNNVGNAAETLAGNIVGVLHMNDAGQLLDANGNIISAQKYEALPEGYRYVIDENGYVAVAPVEFVTTPTPDNNSNERSLWVTYAIAGGLIVVAALVLVLIFVLRAYFTNPKTKLERMKKRKSKEKAKREKQENKQNKKKK